MTSPHLGTAASNDAAAAATSALWQKAWVDLGISSTESSITEKGRDMYKRMSKLATSRQESDKDPDLGSVQECECHGHEEDYDQDPMNHGFELG